MARSCIGNSNSRFSQTDANGKPIIESMVNHHGLRYQDCASPDPAGLDGLQDTLFGVIQDIVLSDGGSGYDTAAPTIEITGNNEYARGATAECTVAAGVIDSLTVTAGGLGYWDPDEVAVIFRPDPADLATAIPPQTITVEVNEATREKYYDDNGDPIWVKNKRDWFLNL